jgi:uncharacterized protein (DUF697 family)
MAGLKGKVGPMSLVALLRDARQADRDSKPLAVAGARELVPILARELRAGGEPGAVVEQDHDGAAALVWIGEPDEVRLRSAHHAKIPIVAVTEATTVPHVAAGDLVRVPPGQGFPVERIAAAVARKLDEDGISLAARLPVLREPVTNRLISATSRRNGLIGVAVFVPGVDMPILTFNQLRMVLRIALAHGEGIERRRAFELLGVVGAGFTFRAIARSMLDFVPVGGWAVKGVVAYTGTRAVGEAAVRYFGALKEPPSG